MSIKIEEDPRVEQKVLEFIRTKMTKGDLEVVESQSDDDPPTSATFLIGDEELYVDKVVAHLRRVPKD